MIEVKIRMDDLQPGDVFKGVGNDECTEYTVKSVDIDDLTIRAEPSDVYCALAAVELTLVATERVVVERVLDALDRYPAAVRRELARYYCVERGCGKR